MKIAVIGATGAVGREIIADLEECPVADLQLVALASPRSQGSSLSFRGKHLTVKAYSPQEIKDCAFVLMSAGSAFSKAHARDIAQLSQGTVIDNSSAWRMDPRVPLVVPEINGALLHHQRHTLIANPNCSTIQLVMSLAPLEKIWGLELVNVVTLQSVSGSGQKGVDELSGQVRAQMNFSELQSSLYPQPIAFNVLPAIGAIDGEGFCEEEVKIIAETRKIMDLPGLMIMPSTARVPVFYCHSEAVTVKLKKAVTRGEVLDAWQGKSGLELHTSNEDFPSPLTHAGKTSVAISRLRLGPADSSSLSGERRSSWLSYWNLADNIKKGAATNAVQIFTELSSRYQAAVPLGKGVF